VNGLAVRGLRRLSSRTEDLYVYELTNTGAAEREVHEDEFDGAGVLAVSILPRPLLRPGERAVLVVLAAKRQGLGEEK
ncbi:type-F conjugative transfer system secretin TraK, partial [Escherichia coli]|uniref:type-F conjugative transfer system secretin TraK n=1 Tax=Escherichia coli TaxID=562 RepID=UPI00192A4216